MPKITPFLWFDKGAEEAANFYVSVFPNSKIRGVTRYPAGSPGPEDGVMTVDFELDGKPFSAINGGPHFTIDEAISFVIHCKDQAEVDYYWDKLTADGGQESQCGWLKDRFGVSWQVTPQVLLDMIADPATAAKVTPVMMTMVKLDVAALEAAAAS